MAEDKTNKSSPVRLPDDLRRKLRKEAFERGQGAEREPSFGELLAEAWAVFERFRHETPKAGEPPATQTDYDKIPISGIDRSETPNVESNTIRVTRDDLNWVKKLLKILHSAKPGLPTAAKNNLEEFVWADEAWNELQKQQSPLVSVPAAGTSGRGRAAENLTSIAGDRGDRGEHPEPEDEIDRAIDEVEERKGRLKQGKKGPHRKTGEGG